MLKGIVLIFIIFLAQLEAVMPSAVLQSEPPSLKTPQTPYLHHSHRNYEQYLAMAALKKNRLIHQKQITAYTALNPDEISNDLDRTILALQDAGISTASAQEYILTQHHLYGIPAFIDYIKELPSYLNHIKQIHAAMTSRKSPAMLYALTQHMGAIPPEFSMLDERVTHLYEEIIEYETNIVREQLEKTDDLLDEYDEDLFWHNERFASRIKNRRDALASTHTNPLSKTERHYALTRQATALLNNHALNPNDFTQCLGTPIQQCIHKELINIIHETDRLSLSSDANQTSITTMLECVDVAREFNAQGQIEKACTVADFCWALLEGVRDGIRSAATDIIEHPLETAACVIAGEYILTYQLLKVTSDVAQIGITACINAQEGSRQWHDYIAPIEQYINAIKNKEISLQDAAKGASQITTHLITQGKLLRSLGKFYTNTKTAALTYVQKNPLATPQQYMATPEGLLFKAINNSDNIANANSSIRDTPRISNVLKASKKAAIKKAQLPTKGKIRYVPPKNWHPRERLPSKIMPNGKPGFIDRFGNIWTRGESRTAGEWREWDVQLSKQGIQQVGWMTRDNSHLNVSLKGRVTHK